MDCIQIWYADCLQQIACQTSIKIKSLYFPCAVGGDKHSLYSLMSNYFIIKYDWWLLLFTCTWFLDGYRIYKKTIIVIYHIYVIKTLRCLVRICFVRKNRMFNEKSVHEMIRNIGKFILNLADKYTIYKTRDWERRYFAS